MTDHPPLTFPSYSYGKHAHPWDLRALLYRGGAAAIRKDLGGLIARGELVAARPDRLPLVEKIHQEIEALLVGGSSQLTIRSYLRILFRIFVWSDAVGLHLTLETMRPAIKKWAEKEQQRQRVNMIKPETAYATTSTIASLMDRVFDLPPGTIFRDTRTTLPKSKKRVLGTQADKQKLAETLAFGHALLDITDSLPEQAIKGPLPVLVPLRTGQVIELWSGLQSPDAVRALTEKCRPFRKRASLALRARHSADASLSIRFPLLNLRMEAELLIFIAQTGMNLAQALKLKTGQFIFQSHLDGYQVRRVYKNRRKGEVEFEIYSAYRDHLERYLSWRKAFFPRDEDGLLFPFFAAPGKSVQIGRCFHSIKSKFEVLGIAFIGPRKLRATRLNWLLRKSLSAELTAEINQHTKETLVAVYEQPHHQVASVEVSRFFSTSDPFNTPPGPGACSTAGESAEPMPNTPEGAPQPDCVSPAGCLFCNHQRDIDSADHAWSLCSYRHLKSLDLARYRPPASTNAEHPAKIAIDRVTAKLNAFEVSSEVRRLWVVEALARIAEGDFHPRWDGFISLAELM